jgi:cytochrome c biogenesis protein ResB
MQLQPIKSKYVLKFVSLRTGVTLMVVLAAASVFGTAFSYEKSLALVFYSWWFRGLLLVLAFNLIFCTYQTLATKVFPALKPRFPNSSTFPGTDRMSFLLEVCRPPQEVEMMLRRGGYRVYREGEYLTARRGTLRLFAAPTAHLGAVLVLLAGFVSGFVAFSGHIRLNEGESTTTMEVSGDNEGMRPLGFQVRCLDFDTATFPQTEIPSRFVSTLEIRDDDKQFVGAVEVNKALKHRGLEFHQSGFGEVAGRVRYRLAVTDSLSSKSVETLATVGQATPVANLGYTLLLTRGLGGIRYSLLDGQKVVATGSIGRDTPDLRLTALRFVPDFVIGPDRQVTSRSENMNNPALQVAWVHDDKTQSQQWLFQRPELRRFSHEKSGLPRLELENVKPGSEGELEFDIAVYDNVADTLLGRIALPLGGVVDLAGLDSISTKGATGTTSETLASTNVSKSIAVKVLGTEPLYYTDLTVSYNPMIPLIYFGSVLAILGICFALYMHQTTLSVWCENLAGRISVTVRYIPERSQLTHSVRRILEVLK